MADKETNVVFERPHALLPVVTNYCPGCTHGIINRLVAECLDELDVEGDAVGVAPVGCSVMAYDFFGCDMIEAAHGRAPAVATAVKRVHPGNVVFAYQGDGDLASIGMAETIHAATRGENITVIFINNAIYGMTGGQMAPTSLPHQVTQTSPYGRDTDAAGFPIRVCELLSSLDGVAYLELSLIHIYVRAHVGDHGESGRREEQEGLDPRAGHGEQDDQEDGQGKRYRPSGQLLEFRIVRHPLHVVGREPGVERLLYRELLGGAVLAGGAQHEQRVPVLVVVRAVRPIVHAVDMGNGLELPLHFLVLGRG